MPTTRARSAVVTIVTMAMLVAAVESAARLLAPRLPAEPGKWPRREIAAKFVQMRELRNKGRGVDVVFVGNSAMMNAVNPVRFERRTGSNAYNAAFPGASPRTLMPWTLDVVVPRLDPEVIVLGVASRDLNAHGKVQADMHRAFVRSPGYRQLTAGLDDRAEGFLERHFAFLRYRREIRRPATLVKHVAGPKDKRKDPRFGFTGRLGNRLLGRNEYTVEREWARRQRKRTLNDYEVGGPDLRAIERLHRRLEARGVDLVLLNVPVTDDYVELHPRGADDMAAYNDALIDLTQRLSIPLIDGRYAFDGSGMFKDPIHLDNRGRRAFTDRLSALWDRIPDDRGVTLKIRAKGRRETSDDPEPERRAPAGPGTWPRWDLAAKYAQIRRLSDQGHDFDVAFVGNSSMMSGLHPVRFRDATGLKSYNAAFPGPAPRTLLPWTLDVVVPFLSPDTVVLGIESRDLNRNGKVQPDMHRRFVNSVGYRQLVAGEDDHPNHLPEPKTEVGRFGTRPIGPADYRVDGGWASRQRKETLVRFDPGGVDLRALRKLHAALSDRDIDLILMDMPVTDDFIDLHPRGAKDARAYRALLSRFAQRRSIPLVLAQRAISGTARYEDPVHLDSHGRRRFTDRLARAWNRLRSSSSPTVLKGR